MLLSSLLLLKIKAADDTDEKSKSIQLKILFYQVITYIFMLTYKQFKGWLIRLNPYCLESSVSTSKMPLVAATICTCHFFLIV